MGIFEGLDFRSGCGCSVFVRIWAVTWLGLAFTNFNVTLAQRMSAAIREMESKQPFG